jgi:hypothetical protein
LRQNIDSEPRLRVLLRKESRLPVMIGKGLTAASPSTVEVAEEPLHEATQLNGTYYVAQCELGRGVFARRVIRRPGARVGDRPLTWPGAPT